jgi:hypothetical protein
MSDMSDTSRDERGAIRVHRTVNARQLSRAPGAVLREVAFEGHSVAVEYCGRVVGFVIPVGDRVPVRRGRSVVYEPQPEPVHELNEVQRSIVGTLSRLGSAVPDQLIGTDDFPDVLVALGTLEVDPPLVRKTWSGYELTDLGLAEAERHFDHPHDPRGRDV